MYGSPILDIKWHRTLNSERPKLITTDNHMVRIWDPETGDGTTSIEPTAGPINDICLFRESGLMFLALDGSQIPSYFIPALGPAPKWCSYLENLTEELEEEPQTAIYDNFKFLSKQELERLNLTNFIGTNLLRAYMHGFFIDYRLYIKAKSLADPFAYDAYIEQRKKEKLDAKFATRITLKKKLPKVNLDLAARLLENEEAQVGDVRDDDGAETNKKTSKKRKGLSTEVLKDDRFQELFKNKNFEVDPSSQEWKSLHPAPSKKQPSLIEEHFEPVIEEDDDQRSSDSDVSAGHSSEDEGNDQSKNRKKSRVPKLYEVKDERHAEAYWKYVSLAKEDALPLGEKVAALQDQRRPGIGGNVKLGPGGSREISFISRSSAKYKEDMEDEREAKRRGIQALGLKSDRSESFRGRGGRGGGGRGGGRGRGRGGGAGGGFRGKSRGRGRR